MERRTCWDQSHHRDVRYEFRISDLDRSVDTGCDDLRAAGREVRTLLATADVARACFWLLGLLVRRRIGRHRMPRRSNGDHARACLPDSAGLRLELEREPATTR